MPLDFFILFNCLKDGLLLANLCTQLPLVARPQHKSAITTKYFTPVSVWLDRFVAFAKMRTCCAVPSFSTYDTIVKFLNGFKQNWQDQKGRSSQIYLGLNGRSARLTRSKYPMPHNSPPALRATTAEEHLRLHHANKRRKRNSDLTTESLHNGTNREQSTTRNDNSRQNLETNAASCSNTGTNDGSFSKISVLSCAKRKLGDGTSLSKRRNWAKGCNRGLSRTS